MKNILPFFLVFTLFSNAQVTNEGQPLSWDMNLDKNINAKELPAFDVNTMNDQDAINDNKTAIPWRFGYMHSVDYGFDDGVAKNLFLFIGFELLFSFGLYFWSKSKYKNKLTV